MGTSKELNVLTKRLNTATLHLARALLCAGMEEDAFAHFQEASKSISPKALERELEFILEQSQTLLREGPADQAVLRYQDIIELMGEATPESIYKGLSRAYARNTKGFGGSREENHCWGDCSKHDVLQWLHHALEPQLYLEIGVDKGLSLACANCKAIGVDPREELKLRVELPNTSRIIDSSSDRFFKDANQYLDESPDLIFIDGMHLFEFALRDFIHAETLSAETSLIVIDDIFPCHTSQSLRRRITQAWAGDVWKLHAALAKYRPDLTLLPLNAHTTGLLLIAGLNPKSRDLTHRYDEIVDEWKSIREAPMEVIDRHGALPSAHPLTITLVKTLNRAKDGSLTTERLRKELEDLKTEINEAQAAYKGKAYAFKEQDCQFPRFDPEEKI